MDDSIPKIGHSATSPVCEFHYSPTNADNEILSKDPKAKDCIYCHGDKDQCNSEQEYGKCT